MPVRGMIWYDTASGFLRVYNGNVFVPVSQQTSSNSAPTVSSVGDQWWDTVNQQLRVYTGTTWQLIGPSGALSQGVTGAEVVTIRDTAAVDHNVVAVYSDGTLVSITSGDAVFTPASTITGFGNIGPGITVANTGTFLGTATNAITVNGLSTSQLARLDVKNIFVADQSIQGNLTLNNSANVQVNTDNSLWVQNLASHGNINLVVNTGTASVSAITINGTTGLATVAGDPTSSLGVVTKQYVDNIFADQSGSINTIGNQLLANLQAVYNTLEAEVAQVNYVLQHALDLVYANIGSTIQTLVANIINANTAQTTTTSNLVTTTANTLQTTIVNTASQQAANNANFANSITSLQQALHYLAPINNPVFTGTPLAPLPASTDNSGQVATTAWVNTTVSNALVNTNLTGTPTVPTPAGTDNSNQIANTFFVKGKIDQLSNTLNGLITQLQGNSSSAGTAISGIQQQLSLLAPKASPALTGNATLNGTALATTSTVSSAVSGLAPLASPAFTGNPTAPTPGNVNDNSGAIATTAFVRGAIVNAKVPNIQSGVGAPPNSGNDGDIWLQIG
jgi:hypothetical protein